MSRRLLLVLPLALASACSLNPRGELPGVDESTDAPSAGGVTGPDGITGSPEGALPGEPASIDEPGVDAPGDDGALIEQPTQEGEIPLPPANPEPTPGNAPSPSVAPTAAPPSTPTEASGQPGPLAPDSGTADAGSATDGGNAVKNDGGADAGAADAAIPE